jgi:serine/threonine protein kinase
MPILTAEERVGTVLGGRYRLESILGTGGTSTVYRAVHTFTNRSVALKLLKPEHSRDRDLVARFLKEARVASTIIHPHVVAILDMGTDEDCTFLAMELLSGESLAARLARIGALSPETAITLLRPLMEAITVAHDKGIVHRDIKPDNVLVGDRGDGIERAVLLDFGMAKTTESAWGHMTQSGVLVGTPYYMSPEQAEGADDLGPATDVWSMGVLLYRALSGDLPFAGSTPTALLLAIARGDHVPLGTRAPSLPPPIAAWVEGALSTDRSARYPDMRAMLDALDRALGGELRAAPIASSAVTTSGVRSLGVLPSDPALSPPNLDAPRGHSRGIVYASLGLLVALGLGFAAWRAVGASDPSERASSPAPVAAAPVVEPAAPVAVAVPVEPAADEEVAAEILPEPPVSEDPPETTREARRERPRREHTETPPAESTPASAGSPPAPHAGGTGLVTEW